MAAVEEHSVEFPLLLEVYLRAKAQSFVCHCWTMAGAARPAAPSPAFYLQICGLHIPTQLNINSAYLLSQRWGFVGSSGAENAGTREMEKTQHISAKLKAHLD